MLGGARKKLRPNSGQRALLDALWHRLGGVGAIAKTLGVHIQAPVNWRLRGKVPLKLCYHVAKTYGLSETEMYGLNYNDMFIFNRVRIPPWPDVVKTFKFPREIETSILELKAPLKSS